ncbi:MAG: hypothetical protein ACI9UA_002589 [Pseudoalteromonas tetraodonis]|jgi:hypothetical protein
MPRQPSKAASMASPASARKRRIRRNPPKQVFYSYQIHDGQLFGVGRFFLCLLTTRLQDRERIERLLSPLRVSDHR